MSAAFQNGAGGGLRRDILTTLLPGFAGPAAPERLLALLDEGLGGVPVRLQRRDPSAARRARAPAAQREPRRGGRDRRGGRRRHPLLRPRGAVSRQCVLGRIDDLELTRAVGHSVGEALAAVAVTMTFAPDADINSNPLNPVIGVRSFGASPDLVARHTAAWVEGVQSAGIDAAAKHFPEHGDTATDSHLALPVVDLPLERLRERELAPFRAAIAAGTRSIMTSHILLPQLDAEQPATLSSRILQRLLRGELGFEGVIVSDALDMAGASGVHGIPEAAVRALAAGCDLLCIGTDNTAPQMEKIVAAIASGRFRPAGGGARDGCRGVRALAAGHPARGGPSDAGSSAGASLPLELPADLGDRIAASFHVADGALARLGHGSRIGTVVRIDTVANIAVGGVPWGPFALLAEPDPQRPAPACWRMPRLAVDAGTPLEDPAGLAGPCSSWARTCTAIRSPSRRSRACAPRNDVVTVDMGWPSDDLALADVAFGASRSVAEASPPWSTAPWAPHPRSRRHEARHRHRRHQDRRRRDRRGRRAQRPGAHAHRLRRGGGRRDRAAHGRADGGLAGVDAHAFHSIGIGIPGSVDSATGRVTHAVNLGLEELDLGPRLSDRLGVDVRVENDVKAAALGAHHLLGVADGIRAHSMAYLNLGPGWPPGSCSTGTLRGGRGVAGEIGHIPVDPAGSGARADSAAALETIASGSALATLWPTQHRYPAVDLFDRADAGDARPSWCATGSSPASPRPCGCSRSPPTSTTS